MCALRAPYFGPETKPPKPLMLASCPDSLARRPFLRRVSSRALFSPGLNFSGPLAIVALFQICLCRAQLVDRCDFIGTVWPLVPVSSTVVGAFCFLHRVA